VGVFAALAGAVALPVSNRLATGNIAAVAAVLCCCCVVLLLSLPQNVAIDEVAQTRAACPTVTPTSFKDNRPNVKGISNCLVGTELYHRLRNHYG